MLPRQKILVVGLELYWPGVARLPRALQDAGFEVGVACRDNAFLAHTGFRDRFFPLPKKNRGKEILACLEAIVREWSPDLLLPTDDRTVFFLARVHELVVSSGNSSGLADLLKCSLGNPAAIREAASKRLTMEIGRELGIRVPASQVVRSKDEAWAFGRKHGFPVVLKRSFDSGGNGVFICQNETEVASAFKFLHRDETLQGRLQVWRERIRGRKMEFHWLPVDPSITVSRFLVGERAMSLMAVFEGRMLAALPAVMEQSYLDTKGPGSVVRFVRHEEMRRASEVLLKHWKLTGLIGFDFMIDAQGHAWLIECNPRPTPIAHLGARAGEDLCLALHRRLISEPMPRTGAPVELVVAHFPQESWRDPNSPYLTSAFHDVPWDDPQLLDYFKQSRAPKRQDQ
ncbi:MAG TPA: ATP-grasp domain-containing protein [Verrucomicrobiae bacterium]